MDATKSTVVAESIALRSVQNTNQPAADATTFDELDAILSQDADTLADFDLGKYVIYIA